MNLHTDPFEDQLRESLHSAGSLSPDLDLDPAAVIGEGTRVVRRRRVIAASGGVAAAIVLSVGTYAAISAGVPKATSVPGSGGPSASAPTVPGLTTATLSLSSSSSNGSTPVSPEEITITATLDTHESLTSARVVARRGATTISPSSVGVDLGSPYMNVIRLPELNVIVTLSPVSDWVDVRQQRGAKGGVSSDSAVLGTSGWQVNGFRFESAAEMSLVRTAIRATADGAVLDQDANPLASARSQDGQRLVYTDTALDILGFAERDTSNATTSWDRVSMWPSEVKEGSRPGLMGGSEDAREGRHGLVVVLVDGPVTDLQLTGVPDATNVRTESLALSQGKVALVATYGTTAGMGTFRPALTWTDAAGRAQSYNGS